MASTRCRRRRRRRKFRDGPANGVGKRLGHLVQALGIGNIDAGDLDCDGWRGDCAQLAHWGGNGHLRRTLEAAEELCLDKSCKLTAQIK